MNEMESRLATCFTSVLPTLSITEIEKANPDSVPGWDSVATVTLFAVVEEEFGVEIGLTDLKSGITFQNILTCIQTKLQGQAGQPS